MSDEGEKKSSGSSGSDAAIGLISLPTLALLVLAFTFGLDTCGDSHETKCAKACPAGVASVSPVHCACK